MASRAHRLVRRVRLPICGGTAPLRAGFPLMSRLVSSGSEPIALEIDPARPSPARELERRRIGEIKAEASDTPKLRMRGRRLGGVRRGP